MFKKDSFNFFLTIKYLKFPSFKLYVKHLCFQHFQHPRKSLPSPPPCSTFFWIRTSKDETDHRRWMLRFGRKIKELDFICEGYLFLISCSLLRIYKSNLPISCYTRREQLFIKIIEIFCLCEIREKIVFKSKTWIRTPICDTWFLHSTQIVQPRLPPSYLFQHVDILFLLFSYFCSYYKYTKE